MKANRDYEAGEPPNPELMAAMGPYVEKMAQRGILVETGGLFPSARGTRVSLANDSFTDDLRGPCLHGADKLVARYAYETHVAAKNLQIGGADTGKVNFDQSG